MQMTRFKQHSDLLPPAELGRNRVISVPALMLTAALTAANLPIAKAQNAYIQHNLDSDLSGVAAFTDTNLVNPWGMAFSASGPFWISDCWHRSVHGVQQHRRGSVAGRHHPGASRRYKPGDTHRHHCEFGLRLYGDRHGHGAFYLLHGRWHYFCLEWRQRGGTQGGLLHVQRGLQRAGRGFSRRHESHLCDGFSQCASGCVQHQLLPGLCWRAGSRTTDLPAGFAPFGIQNVNGLLYVTYALQAADKYNDVAGPGNGYVDVFDTSGNLLQRFAAQERWIRPGGWPWRLWDLDRSPGIF